MKKSRPGATTVLAKAKTEWNSEKKNLKKKLASAETRGKDWEGGKVDVTLSLSQTTARLASLAKFFVSPYPIFPFQPSPGLFEKGQGCIKRILFVTVF